MNSGQDLPNPADEWKPCGTETPCDGNLEQECCLFYEDDNWRRYFYRRRAYPQSGSPKHVFLASFVVPETGPFAAIQSIRILQGGLLASGHQVNQILTNQGITLPGRRTHLILVVDRDFEPTGQDCLVQAEFVYRQVANPTED